jgi:TatD DNase family protein
MLIDSHCHLDYYSEAELPEVLARAAAAGVAEMVTIGTTLAQSDRILALTSSCPAQAGHPRLHSATKDVDGRPSPATTG